MKLRGSKLTKAGVLLLFALLLTVVVAACGGGGSSSSSTAEETTPATEEEPTTEPAEGEEEETESSETAAWSLPNANVQNTRSIESAINVENVSTLKPAWQVNLNGAGVF